jgi:hypothetical protein
MEDGMGSACGPHWGENRIHSVLLGKSERKRTLGKSRRRWRIILKIIFEK